MSTTASEELIRGIVRGEKPLELLETLGVHVSQEAGAYRVEGAGTVVARPSLEDVAAGIVNCARSGVSQCRRWSAVILAASAVIDLACLEESKHGASLLEALWDAAETGVFEEQALSLAQRLVQVSGRQV